MSIEERIKELNFTEPIEFSEGQMKSILKNRKSIGVYIIYFNNPHIYGSKSSSILKIGEGVLYKRFRKYLWSKSFGSTALHVRNTIQKFENERFKISWVECSKEKAKEIEIELLCMFHVTHKRFPLGNKGCT